MSVQVYDEVYLDDPEQVYHEVFLGIVAEPSVPDDSRVWMGTRKTTVFLAAVKSTAFLAPRKPTVFKAQG